MERTTYVVVIQKHPEQMFKLIYLHILTQCLLVCSADKIWKQVVGPDLDNKMLGLYLNCLTLRFVFLKELYQKVNCKREISRNLFLIFTLFLTLNNTKFPSVHTKRHRNDLLKIESVPQF